MAEITNIQTNRLTSQTTQRIDRAATNPSEPTKGEARTTRVDSDRVELSEHSRLLSQLRSQDVRTDLVYNARSEIANGTFLTDERIDGAIDELVRDLDTLG